MNRYHRGSSPIATSRFGSAHVEAQLKVENPVQLRTTRNFDFHRSPRTSYRCRAITYFTGNFDKKSNSAIQCRWRRKHCTQKERPALEGVHRRERWRPGGAATKAASKEELGSRR